MSKYRKNPVVIWAFRLGHDNGPDWWLNAIDEGIVYTVLAYDNKGMPCKKYFIKTLEGGH